MQRDFKRNVMWNVLGSTLNGFNSMFFMVLITRINGLDQAGSYTTDFSLACLFFMIGTYAGRTYQVADRSGINGNDDYIGQRFMTVGLMIIIELLYFLIHGYDAYRFMLASLLLIMKALEAFAEVFYGIMQKEERLHIVGKSLSIKTGIALVFFFVFDVLLKNLLTAFIAVDAVWLILLFTYDIPKSVGHLNPKFRKDKINRLFHRGFYSFAFLFLGVYLVNATKYALEGRVPAASQAAYGILLMPATLINLICLYVLQPIVGRLCVSYTMNRKAEFDKTMNKVIKTVMVLGVIAIIAASTFGIPLMEVIYGTELSQYTFCFQLIAVGATMNAAVTLFSTALTVMQNTRSQFFIYIGVSVFALFASPLLIDLYGVTGAGIAYIATTLLQLVSCIAVYRILRAKWNEELTEQ